MATKKIVAKKAAPKKIAPKKAAVKKAAVKKAVKATAKNTAKFEFPVAGIVVFRIALALILVGVAAYAVANQ